MRFGVLILIFVSSAASAQWATGLSPGTNCAGPYRPANGAMSGMDEVMNLKSQMDVLNGTEGQPGVMEDKLKKIDSGLKKDRGEMEQVLTSGALRAVEEHLRYNNSCSSYQLDCGVGVASVSGRRGAGYDDPESGGRYPGSNDKNNRPPPAEFCVPKNGKTYNVWKLFVENEGSVSENICEHYFEGVEKSKDPDDRTACHHGMKKYYDDMYARAELEKKIAATQKSIDAIDERLGRINDEITAGTWCPTCPVQRRGYSNQGVGDSMSAVARVLAAAENAKGGIGFRYPVRPPPAPRFGPSYPSNLYPGFVPGYSGIGPNNQYGAVGGGVGPNSFGCNGGGNPWALGNPNAYASAVPIYGGQSPFNNPYTQLLFPGQFNPGPGPGWGYPQNGNGVPGYRGPFIDAYGNPVSQAQLAQNQAWVNSQARSPYFQHANVPNFATWNGQNNAAVPYLYGPGYGQAGAGGYYSSVGQFQSGVQYMQNGPYYGGPGPVTAPYWGPTPTYNNFNNSNSSGAPIFAPYIH